MDFKADYIRIYDIADAVTLGYGNLTEQLNDLIKIAEDIKSSWDGPDYENFKNKLIEYVKSLNTLTNDIKYIGDNMKVASRSYEFRDEQWKKEVDKLDTNEVIYEQ